MLNAALGVGIGLLVSWGTKKITEAAQRVQNVATQSKEAADAAQSATSSLKDLVNAYEELGDKSGWDTDDFDQAKDIQAEILDLAKEQGTLDEDKLSKLNLQNGKYEEQLGLLQDITAEQLEASRYELTQNKDAQGDKLVDTAKKNNRTHYLTVWSAPEMDMGDQIKNAGIDVFNKFGGYGPDDLNDADSIIDYYNEVGKALKYVIDHTTEAERAAGGTYHSLYQFLLDEQSALRDDVDSYNDSTDAINNNTNARRKLQAIDFWSDGKSNGMDVSYSFDKVNSAIETLKNTIDDFDASKLNDLLWGTNEGLTDEQAQALAALRKALTDMDFSADTDGVNAFIQALVQVGIVAQSSANGVDALAAGAQKMEDISSKMDEIQSAYKASNSTTPTKDWSTDDAKRLHVGDIYYDCNEEKAYTWTDEYEWLTADDENLLKILKIVSKESDTADGSRRVFFNTPSPPYSKGDVWADYSFNGYMLVCQVSRPISASYNRLDWVVASKYTDDTKADEALDSANKANADLATFKTEYDSDLKVTKEQIEARVTATTYTEDMSSLKKRVSTAESRITQTEKDITLRVEKDDYTGEKLVSMISAQPESVKISAKNIELTGAVTIQNGQTVLNSESVNNSITQIDGGKITTGTIDANRLNLSGGLTIGSGGSITIGNNTISADKLASGSVFKELWRNYEETEYKVGTFSFDNSQTQYNELLFFFRGLFKNGKVDDSQEGTITHVEQVPTGNTDSYGNPEYETKTIIDSKIRIETYYTSTNTMVVPLITNSTIWYHTFFSYPSAYFVRQWEHYKADPSQNIIQGTYKEGMSFNTDVVDNMDYQWCNSNIMRYFSVSVSQNNTVTVTFKNAFRYTTKKGFWDDSGKVSIYPNYAIPRIIYGIK